MKSHGCTTDRMIREDKEILWDLKCREEPIMLRGSVKTETLQTKRKRIRDDVK